VRVVGAVAAGAPAMADSWQRDTVVRHAHTETFADGVAVRVPVAAALDDLRGQVDDVWRVADADILAAMRVLHRDGGLVAEPAGALGLAAVTTHADSFRGQHVATIVSGGNLADRSLLDLPELHP
jgi:threonine dehydratase